MSDSSPAPQPAGPAPSDHHDLGADLTAAWDNQEAAEASTSSAAPAKPASAAPSSGDANKAGAGGPARDDTGRFAKTNGTATTAPASDKPEAKPAPAKAPDAKAAPDAKGDAKPAAAPAESDFKIPEKWPADVRARFENLHKVSPEDAKFALEQFNLVRTQQGLVEQAKAKLAPVAKIMETVENLLAPGRQSRAMQNIDDPTYVRNLIAAGEFLDKNPIEGLKFLAQRYGVDLTKVASGEGQKPEIPEHVQQVMRENAEIKQHLQRQQQAAEQTRLNDASNWVERFANEKDANGQSVRPHFDDVLNEIIVNVQAQRQMGQQVDVHAAYERAVRMNDTVWLKVQGARSDAERKAAQEKQLKDIEEAKRAGFSVSGSGGVTSERPADSLRGELERQWSHHS